MFQETAMDIISRFIATSTILLHVLVILRGQNDLVTAQGKSTNMHMHTHTHTHCSLDNEVARSCNVELS